MTVGSAAAYAAPHATPRAATAPHAASRQSIKVHPARGPAAEVRAVKGNASKKEAATNAQGTPTASLLADTSPPPSSQPAPTVTAASVVSRVGSEVRTISTPAAAASPPAAVVPSVLRDEPMILSSGGWQGVSLQAAVDLRVPILFGAAVLLFVLLQALVDRRDPKVSRAPERGDDDTVGFS